MHTRVVVTCCLVAVLCLVPACGEDPAPAPAAAAHTGTAAGISWAVLPLEESGAFDIDARSCWSPDGAAVEKALAGVGGYLQTQTSADDRAPGVAKRLPEYCCQAIGIVEKKQRRIYLSFFHRNVIEDPQEDEKADWTRTAMVFLDGGDMFWNVQFDPATGAFAELSINGES